MSGPNIQSTAMNLFLTHAYGKLCSVDGDGRPIILCLWDNDLK